MDCSMRGFPILHYLPEFAQVHVHWVGDAIQLSHSLPLSSPFALIFPSIRVVSNEYLEYMYLQYNLYLDYNVSAIQFQSIAKAILRPPDVKSWFIGKTLMLGKIEGRRRRGRQRMRWLDGINGHEFKQTLGDSEGQGSLACCSPWGHKELDTTEQLNNNKIKSQEQIRRKKDNIRILKIHKGSTKMKQKCTK